ncbi:MAG: MerR family transcriptional regulator [Coriobacteriales bacterium]
MQSNEKLYKVADFARLCGLPKDTILYYDRIGLLHPAKVGSNGYRYYSFDQLFTAHLIESLKLSHMTLDEIRDFMSAPDPAAYHTQVARSLDELEQRIRLLEQARASIAVVDKLSGEWVEHGCGEPFVSEMPQAGFLVHSEPFSRDDDGTRFPWQLKELLDAAHAERLAFVPLISELHFDEEAAGAKAGSYAALRMFESPREIGSFPFHVRPQGAYLCTNFFGSYDELPGFYAAFRELAADAQCCVSGPLYQIATGPVFGNGKSFPMRLSAKLESAG